jgi:hypothetical protein
MHRLYDPLVLRATRTTTPIGLCHRRTSLNARYKNPHTRRPRSRLPRCPLEQPSVFAKVHEGSVAERITPSSLEIFHRRLHLPRRVLTTVGLGIGVYQEVNNQLKGVTSFSAVCARLVLVLHK